MTRFKKVLTYSAIGIGATLMLGTGGMLMWTNNTYKPSEGLYEKVSETDYIKDGDFYVFGANEEEPKAGIVLYPGALVEPLAYGHYANELAKEGYLVAIPDVFLNLSITENNKAEEFINTQPEVESWYVGGHSMGGVSATMFAKENEEQVDGIILLGSYPADTTDLSDAEMKVLSLYAENDGLTSLDEIDNSKKNLPDTTIFTEILGGNHAQFGMYGAQSGDQEATIEVVEQQSQMVEATLAFLQE